MSRSSYVLLNGHKVREAMERALGWWWSWIIPDRIQRDLVRIACDEIDLAVYLASYPPHPDTTEDQHE